MPLIVICIGVVESASYFWLLIRRATALPAGRLVGPRLNARTHATVTGL